MSRRPEPQKGLMAALSLLVLVITLVVVFATQARADLLVH